MSLAKCCVLYYICNVLDVSLTVHHELTVY